MLKALKVVFGVVLLVLFVGPVSQILSEAEVFAQTVDTAWVRRYNGTGDSTDVPRAIAVDGSGNVYVTGPSWGSGTHGDYATIKYYPDGDTAWVRRYNGPGNDWDESAAIAVDGSGNVYVTGESQGSGTDWDCATIKYYPNGDTAWIRRYDGPSHLKDYGRALVLDPAGNVYVTGWSYDYASDFDYLIIKYDSLGNEVWVEKYDGPANDYDNAHDIAVDGDGNIYVTGESNSSGSGWDFVTIKYHPNGDTTWVRRYNGPGNANDQAKAIVVDGSGNTYVTGQSEGSGSSDDYATIKYYPNGDTAWVRRYNGPADGSDGAEGIAVDDSGNVFVTGYSDSTGSSQDYATIKYDSSGNQLWVKRYNCANGTDMPTAITLDGSNNVYVTGWSGCGGVTVFDYVTIKYYSNGDTAWVARYHGPVEYGRDYAFALALDSAGNVYVTGRSQGSGTDYDYCTIKYVKTTDVKDETEREGNPADLSLSQNYPNPFNPATKIEFTLAKSGFVTLRIYDVLGRKVITLVSEHLSSGYKSVLWDGKNDDGKDVASGVYFYQLKVGDFSEPKKMVLLK